MKKLMKLTGMSIASLGILTTGLMAEEMMEESETSVAETDAQSSQASSDERAEKPGEEMSVVAIADNSRDFTTLMTALRAADLVEALNGDGPFTIFAPTNEAFAKLPDGALADLLKPENKEKLTSILKYHVVPGKVMASKIMPMKVATLEGHEFEVTVKGADVMVDKARVIKTDILGKNGVIHVIDAVIMPPAEEEQ